MINSFQSLITKSKWDISDKDKLAAFLQTTPEAFELFEHTYKRLVCDPDPIQKQYSAEMPATSRPTNLDRISNQIVEELLSQTKITTVKDHRVKVTPADIPDGSDALLSEVNQIPFEWRPMLTGCAYASDLNGEAWPVVMDMYREFLETGKLLPYHLFRQGLDIQNLEPILYEVLGLNPNSMEHWLPQAAKAAWASDTFIIPDTVFIQVPLPVLQMSRLQYESLNRTTLDIIDQFAIKAFGLNPMNDYFVKTGIFSSKFDFRNAHVPAGQEVLELGEYLIAISNQAVQLCSPLNNISHYGAATTRTWVVRDWIPDIEGNPTIYRGLPLRTEYRCFVDFDTKQILAIAPYWDPETMKKRFAYESDRDNPDMRHDYVVYKAQEDTLMKRFYTNEATVRSKMKKFLSVMENLTGQWSVDIMQNGDLFYLIDMATADTSALSHYVPKKLIKKTEIDWRPKLIQ